MTPENFCIRFNMTENQVAQNKNSISEVENRVQEEVQKVNRNYKKKFPFLNKMKYNCRFQL